MCISLKKAAFLTLVWLLSRVRCSSVMFATQRPLYVIAHMVNSIKEVDYYINQGANAIEVDINFSPNGSAVSTFHGFPCDCLRYCNEEEPIVDYLTYLKTITTPGSKQFQKQVTLLYLDLKLANVPGELKSAAGNNLANILVQHFFDGGKAPSQLKVILSIPKTADKDFLVGFIDEIERRNLSRLFAYIGWDVSLNDPLDDIEKMYQSIDLPKNSVNIWQGDGITNCISPFYNLNRLREAVDKRNEDNSIIRKVYHWTIDLSDRLSETLGLGVDGIVTNHPERVLSLLNDADFAHRFRLASVDDDPFSKIIDIEKSPREFPKLSLFYRIINSLYELFSSLNLYIEDSDFHRNSNRKT